MTAYQTLEQRFHQVSVLGEAIGILHWDQAAVMPDGGADARADQLALLKVMAHERLCAPDMPELFDGADGMRGALEEWRRANLDEMRRRWRHASALEPRLVEALSRACSICERAWRQARPASDYAAVLPYLEEVLRLVREAGAAKADALGLDVYDALLDEYEPRGRAADIAPLLDDLAGFLPDFVGQVLEVQARRPEPVLPEGPFPEAKQKALGERLMAALGFEFDHGRLDTSHHPFCGGGPDDVRITTRYEEGDFTQALMGVLHETGHALYERGLPVKWRHQPVGEALGMAMHESQSLLMEMQACRSRDFLEFAAPLMRAAFGGEGPAWEVDNLSRLYTRVRRSFIRVEADEVTYPAHVILRFRLERAMIAGDLALADLPGAWAEGMKALLDIVPPDDRRGCLQDIHWYDGAWGYFPTYTLGAMTAAQFFDAACRARPEIPGRLGAGDFAPLLSWLRDNVHGLGSRYPGPELIRRATGQPLNPEIFKAHLRRRYLDG